MAAGSRQQGLTWGNSPQVTTPGLNFYRDAAKAQRLAEAHGRQPTTASASAAPETGGPCEP